MRDLAEFEFWLYCGTLLIMLFAYRTYDREITIDYFSYIDYSNNQIIDFIDINCNISLET